MKVSKVIFVLLITSIVAEENSEPSQLLDILRNEDNYFHQINIHVDSVINKLFAQLKLMGSFANRTETKHFLSLRYNFSSLSENNYNTFAQVHNASKIDANKTGENLFDLLDLIDVNVHKIQTDSKEINNTTPVDEIVDSEEIMENVFGEFYGIFNNMTLLDLSSAVKVNKDKFLRDTINAQFLNLKAWVPTSNESENELGTRRIYRGKKTKIKSYPFMASVHVNDEYRCAAAIISKDFVITAASCLHDAFNTSFLADHPDAIKIRLGSDYTKRKGKCLTVTHLFFHPSYDTKSLINNIVIIKMSQQLFFLKKNKKIRRIMYDRLYNGLANKIPKLVVLGWGVKEISENDENVPLARAKIKHYPLDACKDVYSESYVTDRHFCAAFSRKHRAGICHKDIGAPAVIGNTLVGLASFGPPTCGDKAMAAIPTVFTKLGFYADWIDSVLNMESTTTNPEPTRSGILQPEFTYPQIDKLENAVPMYNSENLIKKFERFKLTAESTWPTSVAPTPDMTPGIASDQKAPEESTTEPAINEIRAGNSQISIVQIEPINYTITPDNIHQETLTTQFEAMTEIKTLTKLLRTLIASAQNLVPEEAEGTGQMAENKTSVNITNDMTTSVDMTEKTVDNNPLRSQVNDSHVNKARANKDMYDRTSEMYSLEDEELEVFSEKDTTKKQYAKSTRKRYQDTRPTFATEETRPVGNSYQLVRSHHQREGNSRDSSEISDNYEIDDRILEDYKIDFHKEPEKGLSIEVTTKRTEKPKTMKHKHSHHNQHHSTIGAMSDSDPIPVAYEVISKPIGRRHKKKKHHNPIRSSLSNEASHSEDKSIHESDKSEYIVNEDKEYRKHEPLFYLLDTKNVTDSPGNLYAVRFRATASTVSSDGTKSGFKAIVKDIVKYNSFQNPESDVYSNENSRNETIVRKNRRSLIDYINV